jgi:allophanate hydrolase subunit 2
MLRNTYQTESAFSLLPRQKASPNLSRKKQSKMASEPWKVSGESDRCGRWADRRWLR